MSLPIKAVDRLFERLLATYGEEFSRKWGASPVMDVKSVWAHELSQYANRLDCIAWALDNLPEKAPNSIQFKNLCKGAPSPKEALPALPPPPDPERLADELRKLGDAKASVTASASSGKDWARALRKRLMMCERLTVTQIAMMKEALKEEQ